MTKSAKRHLDSSSTAITFLPTRDEISPVFFHSNGFALSISIIGISSFISYMSLHFSHTSSVSFLNFTGPLHCGQAKISNRSLFIIVSSSRVLILSSVIAVITANGIYTPTLLLYKSYESDIYLKPNMIAYIYFPHLLTRQLTRLGT